MNNSEIANLYKRIYLLENINNIKNENHQYYDIDDFGITHPNYILMDKHYYYISKSSPIYIYFSGYLISNGTANLTFRANVLDDNGDILYSIDKNIDLNGAFDFNMTINIMNEILNANIQFIILGKNFVFNSNQRYMNGYYFRNCNLYIKFNLKCNKLKLSHVY